MAEETFAPPFAGPVPEPAKKGFFSPKAQAPPLETSEMQEKVNVLAARLRIAEERDSEIRKKLLVVEQNMLSNNKKAMAEVKSVQTEINEVKRTIQAVEDKMISIIKELRLMARKEDIDVMKRYLELWDPVKFITAERVEKIIDEKLGKHEDETKINYDSPS